MKDCILICRNGHKILITTANIKNLLKRVNRGGAVCPYCKPANVLLQLFNPSRFDGKLFICPKKHIISIYPFSNGTCNFSWSNKDFCNINASIEEMLELLSQNRVCCPFNINSHVESCNLLLKQLDDMPLQTPALIGIKTKKRVGDVWDQYKCPEPKSGSYDKDFIFKETEFSRRNKSRIKKLRRSRLNKPVGEIIDRPTNRNYKDTNPHKEEI